MKNIIRGMAAVIIFIVVAAYMPAVQKITAAVRTEAISKNSNTDVRIGLEDKYAKKSELKLGNEALYIGYCINGSYMAGEKLVSSTGFSFKPDTGKYIVAGGTYPTYKSAGEQAERLQEAGIEAYPAVLYRNMWKIYIPYNGSIPDGGISSAMTSGISGAGITGNNIMLNDFKLSYTSYSGNIMEKVHVSGQGIEFIIDAAMKEAYPQFRAAEADVAGVYVMDMGERSYRGRIEIGRYGSELLTAINIVNIEAYLYGVVPAEMPASWPAEALKTQAVCARSYALSKSDYYADSSVSSPYVLADTTRSQVYKGYTAERKASSKAVDATKGEVLTYNNKIITAFFFSTSGGRTEQVKYVWSGSYPYLKSVADTYETEPEKKPWSVSFTADQIEAALNKKGYSTGGINDVYSVIETESDRVYLMRFKGNNDSILLKGSLVREMLGLYSTKFKVISEEDTPDAVYAVTADGVNEIRLTGSYVIGAGGNVEALKETAEAATDKTGYNDFQFIVKGADNLANYPAYSPDEGIYVFAGLGYGHGIGMSQSGAKGMALAGFSYKEILKWYYNGTTVRVMN